jgi:drug/metabolite transporter (DMT)-like permease
MEATVKPVSYILIIISVTLAMSGQICLRRGMETLKERTQLEASELFRNPLLFIKEILKTWVVLLGLALFVLSAFSWLIVLSEVPLGIAYPFVSLTYIAVMFYDKIFESYTITAWNWLGVAAIVAGIIMISMGRTSV